MKYTNIQSGIFVERPNRFVALVDMGGKQEQVHVKNTGRCRELLVPGAKVYLEDFAGKMGSRKLRYSLVVVEKKTPRGTLIINMDSQAPNKAVEEALMEGRLPLRGMEALKTLRREYKYGSSRMDFYGVDISGREALIEVKGVTLEENGTARFPDAPTQRGIKHVEELIEARKEGVFAYMIFVIQMKGPVKFEPNRDTHPEFGEALEKAERAGVELLAVDCRVTPGEMKTDSPVEIIL
ncbi:MAG TPA: DNA/RNA nuclease SfsA [Candidatus Copromorpha excrementigallinarum]|uniref:Sugar fermentation stimulation protein homolog n=1 Tax=Candidatus Allocopromorpha excrementigallinarum TaxID=2840742 RepID=A0A9D1I161_9FIRM|nr:DNA/RNA nuclease SfsA [Candidatus Copromorpha excrementigallinarum]